MQPRSQDLFPGLGKPWKRSWERGCWGVLAWGLTVWQCFKNNFLFFCLSLIKKKTTYNPHNKQGEGWGGGCKSKSNALPTASRLWGSLIKGRYYSQNCTSTKNWLMEEKNLLYNRGWGWRRGGGGDSELGVWSNKGRTRGQNLSEQEERILARACIKIIKAKTISVLINHLKAMITLH